MTIRQLSQYRSINAEILELDKEIEKHKVLDSVQGSQQDFPYIMQNHKVVGFDAEGELLRLKRSELRRQRKEIYDYIMSIPDSKVRRIFFMKFIKGKTNQYIAIELEYASETSIRKIIKKYCESAKSANFLIYNLN